MPFFSIYGKEKLFIYIHRPLPYDDHAIISSIRVHRDEQPIHLGELIWFPSYSFFMRYFGERRS